MDFDQNTFSGDPRDAASRESGQGYAGASGSSINELENLLNLLDYLQDAIQFGKSVPLTGKWLIDGKQCLDIIRDIRDNLPETIQYANQVLERQEDILAKAESAANVQSESANAHAAAIIREAEERAAQMAAEAEMAADKVIETAEIKARGLVNQTEIKKTAEEEAKWIRNEARTEANELRFETDAYIEDMHKNTEKALSDAIHLIRQHWVQVGQGKGIR